MRVTLLDVHRRWCHVSRERQCRGCDSLNSQSRVLTQQQTQHWRCPLYLFDQPSMQAPHRGLVVIVILTWEHCRPVG